MAAFAPLGDSSRVTVSDSTSVRTAIGTLPANGVLRIIPLNASQTAFYIKLGDNTVAAARTDSMKVDQASVDNPVIVPVLSSQTHIAILAEGGSGEVLITRGAEIGNGFAPLGAGSQASITLTDQAIVLPSLGSRAPAIRLHALSGNMTALWVKLGNGSVAGDTSTSMKVRPGSKENPTVIGRTASETHLSIFCEGQPGLIQIMGGDAIGENGNGNVTGPASSTDNAVALFDGTSGKLLKNSAITVDANGNVTIDGDNSVLTLVGPANVGIELGNVDGTGGLTFIDFHAGTTFVDYDVRLIANGGTGASGGGTLSFVAGALQFNGVALFTTQATQEAASSNVIAVTPGRQHFHPGHPKAWVKFDSTGTLTNNQDYGVSSLTDVDVGRVGVTFDTAFSTATYGIHATGQRTDTSSAGVVAGFVQAGTTPGTTACNIAIATGGGNFHDTDYGTASFLGDQ